MREERTTVNYDARLHILLSSRSLKEIEADVNLLLL